MARREEVELAWLNKAVQSNYRYDEKSFKEGVEWADKTMIDKACECLIKLHNWPTQYEEYARLQEEFIKEFRKAMEE